MSQCIPLKTMIADLNLTLLTEEVSVAGKTVHQPDINRPALQLAGFFDYFDSDRPQVIGLVEYTYLQQFSESHSIENMRRIFAAEVPVVVLCRGLSLTPEMARFAQEYDVPVLSSKEGTTDFIGEAYRWLRVQLAPRTQVHGVLLDVYGVGVLILGDSGVGKSETALEMIKRGHRFVADDAVEIKRVSQETLIGSCPENIRYFLELRGIGIIDVRQMYGVESIKTTQSIDLVIKLEVWDSRREYDRIGLSYDHVEILGNQVTCHAIPIRPGRNLAIICEAAALNHRQRKMGYNAAHVLTERVMGKANAAAK